MVFNGNKQYKYKQKMLSHGFEKSDSDFFNSTDYDKVRQMMIDSLYDDITNDIKYNLCSKNDILENGKCILKKHFNNIDLKVNYNDMDELANLILLKFGKKPSIYDSDKILELINNNSKKINIYDVDVVVQSGFFNSGKTNNYALPFSIKKLGNDFIKKIPYSISSIYLKGECNEFLTQVYVHEMTHALVNRNKGIVKNMLLNEMLPMFMEKVASYDLNNELLDKVILNRLLSTKRALNNIDHSKNNSYLKLHKKIYILSNICASGLFDLYYKSNDFVKNKIDISVGKVISGEMLLEDLLDEYNINFDNCVDIMCDQCKTYTKRIY